MTRPLTHSATWCPKSTSSLPLSDLDHVYASEHLTFKQWPTDNDSADVLVEGWVDLDDPEERDTWREQYSDHSMLYFEVQEV